MESATEQGDGSIVGSSRLVWSFVDAAGERQRVTGPLVWDQTANM
eukprot:gene32871-33156_t